MTTSSIRKIALMSLLLQSISSAATSAALAQSPPFAGLAGSWTGSGSISLSDGSKERLRCRATYGSISGVVDAPGFSANLTVATRGNRQSFSIVSQGDIRSVAITMVRS